MTITPTRFKFKLGLATLFSVAALVAVAVAPSGASAAACGTTSGGGLSIPDPSCAPAAKAKLVNGKAIPPASAPARVKRVIRWANQIRTKPYIYGGGHGSFRSRGYDCSGAVSYALWGGKFLKTPLDSTSFMNWKAKGLGKWITVFSNPSHAYMVVAGLRWDTSMTGGNGPRWSDEMRSSKGFVARHPAGY